MLKNLFKNVGLEKAPRGQRSHLAMEDSTAVDVDVHDMVRLIEEEEEGAKEAANGEGTNGKNHELDGANGKKAVTKTLVVIQTLFLFIHFHLRKRYILS